MFGIQGLLSSLTHKHTWTTQKLKDFVEEGYSIEAPSEGYLERDVVYCCTCRGKAFLLPLSGIPPIERALRITGQNNSQDAALVNVLLKLLEVMKKTLDTEHWPERWKELGHPRLSHANWKGALDKLGAPMEGSVDVLKAFGFDEEGENLSYKDFSKKQQSAQIILLIESEIESLKANARKYTANYAAAYSALIKNLVQLRSKSEYTEEDYKAVLQIRDILKEVIDSGTLSNPTQAQELLDRTSTVLGDIALHIQEKQIRKRLERALGLRSSESDDQDVSMDDVNDKKQEFQKLTQKDSSKDIYKMKQEEYIRQKEQEQLDMAIKESLKPSVQKRAVPAGLKNVANMCSFNSLLQTYEVLKFRAARKSQNLKQDRVLKFMTELQSLFATMMLTQKSTADPTELIKALLTGASSNLQFGHQEDVHEINLLILDTIEEAFNFNQQGQLVKDAFYGNILEELFLPSEVIRKKDSVAHILLDIEDHHDLYSSLDAYVRTTVAYNSLSEVPKVTSFEKLPDVLIFQLQRTQFNRAQNAAFKVNLPFKFSDTIFMDRYVYANSEIAAAKRKQVQEWQQEIRKLQEKLSWYTNYKNTSMALPKMIEGTYDFVASVERVPDSAFQEALEAHLLRLKEKITAEITEISNVISNLQHKIDTSYEDMDSEHSYVLHSVLVHDGFAGAGHYWTFTKDHRTGNWIKFNDTFVTQVERDTVFKESEGGYSSTSAYCLFYISELSLAQSISVATSEQDLIPEYIKRTILMDNNTPSSQESKILGILEQMMT